MAARFLILAWAASAAVSLNAATATNTPTAHNATDVECGNCLEARPAPGGCTVPAVADCLCAVDPFCCSVMWTQGCVNELLQLGCDGACAPASQTSPPPRRGLSGGQIFTLVVLLTLVVYCVGGATYNRCVRSLDWPELIPNYRLWRAVPGLARDGCSATAAALSRLREKCTERDAEENPLTHDEENPPTRGPVR